MEGNINNTERCSEVFRPAVKNNKAKVGIYLLAAFLGVATIAHFVVPEKAEALPKPKCSSGILCL